MKLTYLSFNNWEVEHPFNVGGKVYRVDAYNPKTGAIREFVHSIPRDKQQLDLKARDLRLLARHNVKFIYDGDRFASKAVERPTKDTLFGLLKPSAYYVWHMTGGDVHFESCLYKKAGADFWRRRKDEAALAICARFNKIQRGEEV